MPATRLHPDDVLLGALVLAAPRDGMFTGLSERIHRAFHTRRSDPEFADLLQAFEFSDEAPYPYSAALARALGHLQRSRLIGMANPDFRRYFVDPGAPSVFRDVVQSAFTREELGRLQALSESLWAELREQDGE
jgi:hypothetical protein